MHKRFNTVKVIINHKDMIDKNKILYFKEHCNSQCILIVPNRGIDP